MFAHGMIDSCPSERKENKFEDFYNDMSPPRKCVSKYSSFVKRVVKLKIKEAVIAYLDYIS